MSSTAFQILIFALCWMGVGLAAAVILRRRAHEFGPNAALGVILGPLFVFLAYDMIRRRESEKPISLAHPSDAPGSSVLVVAVGDLDRPEAVRAAIDEVGDVGPVSAAIPVEYEISQRVHALGDVPPQPRTLDELAESLSEFNPGLMMLPGRLEKSIPLAIKATDADLVLLVGSEGESAAPELEKVVRPRIIRVRA